MNSFNHGFTLIELLVTLAIAAIVLTMGIPSFQSSITSNRLTTTTNDFISTLHFARSEAVKRNQTVVISPAGAQWENGWQVFLDNDNSNNFTAGDVVLKVHGALTNGFTFRDQGVGVITYNNNGQILLQINFVLCAVAIPAPNTSRLIIISAVGRSSVADDTNLDGIPNFPGAGNIAACIPPF